LPNAEQIGLIGEDQPRRKSLQGLRQIVRGVGEPRQRPDQRDRDDQCHEEQGIEAEKAGDDEVSPRRSTQAAEHPWIEEERGDHEKDRDRHLSQIELHWAERTPAKNVAVQPVRPDHEMMRYNR